jgi:hypothetical protein
MRLEALQQAFNEERQSPKQVAEYLIYMPPSGSPVECPPGFDIVQAGQAASRVAARTPGRMVGVYVLVGTAFQPIVEPSFITHSSE